MHATAKSAVATTVAIDLAKDVFELAFADVEAHMIERRRLSRIAFAKAFPSPSLSIATSQATDLSQIRPRRLPRPRARCSGR